MVINKHAKFWVIPIQNVGGVVHTNFCDGETVQKQYVSPRRRGERGKERGKYKVEILKFKKIVR